MTTNYPMLSTRGEISLALKQIWPGHFELKRHRHGFGVTLSHTALQRTVVIQIDDTELRHDLGILVRDLIRKAWAHLLNDAEVSPWSRVPLYLSPVGVPVCLEAEVKGRTGARVSRGP
jgi:hypothetical protein